jgi:hypothetical protein
LVARGTIVLNKIFSPGKVTEIINASVNILMYLSRENY